MASALIGEYPIYSTGTHAYYVGLLNEILVIARINQHTRDITDTYSFHYAKGCIPIAGAKGYPEITKVNRQLNRLLLFYSNIPFYTHKNYHYFAYSDENVIFINIKAEPTLVDIVAMRENPNDSEWQVMEWLPRTESESDFLITSIPKAREVFYDHYKYC